MPVQVDAAAGWSAVSTGRDHACGIRADGSLWCWGSARYGQLGTADAVQRTIPVRVGAAMVSSGGEDACALHGDGTLWCWGINGYGEAGTGIPGLHMSPVQAGTATNWARVSTGTVFETCGIRTDGTLWCWGGNNSGQLGVGDLLPYRAQPTAVTP